MRGNSIGKVAKAAGVGIETIRFYERQGLIPEPPRLDSGYRRYPDETVQRLRFIRRAKEMGFTLKEINELLVLRHAAEAPCDEVCAQAEAKITVIQDKIRLLERMELVLKKLVAACRAGGPATGCAILDALETGEQLEET